MSIKDNKRRRRLLWLLHIGPDTLSDATPYLTKGRAMREFRELSSQVTPAVVLGTLYNGTSINDVRPVCELSLSLCTGQVVETPVENSPQVDKCA